MSRALKFIGLLVMVSPASFASPAESAAQEARPFRPHSFEAEVKALLARPTYAPDAKGIDFRYKDFRSLTLAYLFLTAVREQYQTLNVKVSGDPAMLSEDLFYHRAINLFDEMQSDIFSRDSWIRVAYSIVPDLDREFKVQIEKLTTFEQIEDLRAQLIKILIQPSAGDPADLTLQANAVAEKMQSLVRAFPGNSSAERAEYLSALIQSPEGDDRLENLRDDLRFESAIADIYSNNGGALPASETSLYALASLRDRFRYPLDKDLVVWTKVVPILQSWGGRSFPQGALPQEAEMSIEQLMAIIPQMSVRMARQGGDISVYSANDYQQLMRIAQQTWWSGQVGVRFYLSQTEVFKREGLEMALPLMILKAWRRVHDSDEDRDGSRQAIDYVGRFLVERKEVLPAKAYHRVFRIYKMMLEGAYREGIIKDKPYRPNAPAYKKRSWFRGDFKVGLEAGHSFAFESGDVVRPAAKSEVGIRSIHYSRQGLDFDADIDPQAQRFSTKVKWGWFEGANSSGSYADHVGPNREWDIFDIEGEELRLRYFDQNQLTISSVVLNGSREAGAYFERALKLPGQPNLRP